MAKDRIPTSRVARSAKVGRLAATQTAKHLGTRATNVARSEEGRSAALERRHLEAAEQIVTALGTMKGAAMKLGQVMSFLDVGLVPEEFREAAAAVLNKQALPGVPSTVVDFSQREPRVLREGAASGAEAIRRALEAVES